MHKYPRLAMEIVQPLIKTAASITKSDIYVAKYVRDLYMENCMCLYYKES